MKNVKLFLEGFIIGIGKIIPGVSGSVMAICFGLYERIVSAISSIVGFKKNVKFLIILGFGVLLAIVLGSGVIKFFLETHYVKTMMFFIGMMLPGLVPIIKSVKNEDLTPKRLILCMIIFAFLYILSIANFTSGVETSEPYFHEFLSLILCGVLDAASTIIPGISGSALLMIVGYYEKIITALANLTDFSEFSSCLLILIPFFIGLIIGLVLTSKLITYLFNHHRALTYMFIIVFASYSILVLLEGVLTISSSFAETLFASLYLAGGVAFTCILNKLCKC